MKIAAISDIHGNIAALSAVLEDIGLRGCDMIVNLGDICSGPLYPRETADLLMDLGLPTIRGNHERNLLEAPPEALNPSDRFARSELRPDHIAWFSDCPLTLSPCDGMGMVHGTPRSDTEYFLHTVDADGLRQASVCELTDRAGGCGFDLILCGHTHLSGGRRLPDGRLIVNPGSVGLPAYAESRPFPHAIENGTPGARYAMIDRTDGGWSADFIEVAYDWHSAAGLAASRGRQDWAIALSTGLVA